MAAEKEGGVALGTEEADMELVAAVGASVREWPEWQPEDALRCKLRDAVDAASLAGEDGPSIS